MAVQVSVVGDRFLSSGDEAGTAPGDRRFRPDVEGLRAVAVLLVVLFHAGVPGLSGGYVGVDVFFVISGFVITGVLLRERAIEHRTSILAFYGRRCRRIIPAATLVIIVTTVAAYAVLGAVGGNRTAIDGKWAAVFLANFHFASVGTNYLTATLPPSPLQNYWSLAVEEQFYFVYPTLFVLVAWMSMRVAFRTRMAIGLIVVIAASFTLSVVQTATESTVAYFSPFTRAWELALGALVAVSTPVLLRMSHRLAAPMTWIGLGAIVVSAFWFTSDTAYPGWHVAIPVIGTALVIAAGAVAPRGGAEALLRTYPLRHLGRLSYSLYLWHWPILILAAESADRSTLPLSQAMGWLLVSLVASVVTYHFVENPIRHFKFALRHRWASVGLGLGLVVITLSVLTVQLQGNGGNNAAASTAKGIVSSQSTDQVQQLITASLGVRSVPRGMVPASWGAPPASSGCLVGPGQTSIPGCVFGDLHGSHTMVIYGDSHAAMWFQTLNDIAIRAHWRLIIMSKGSCAIDMLHFVNPPGWGVRGGEWQACDEWHNFAIKRINQVDPNLIILTQEAGVGPGFTGTRHVWQGGLETLISDIRAPRARIVVLGNIPVSLKGGGPDCLAHHPNDIRVCAGSSPDFYTPWRKAEEAAAAARSATYIDTLPWFCSKGICPAVIGPFDVYVDMYHVSGAYASYLEVVLAQALQLPIKSTVTGEIPPTTKMLVPANGQTVSGTRVIIDARGSSNLVGNLQFVLTGGHYNKSVIGTGVYSIAGFVLEWNSSHVPNGTYLLQSRGTDDAGGVTYSSGITVTVHN